MAFNFNTSKSATGFTLPTATIAGSIGGQFNVTTPGAGGDLGAAAKASSLFGASAVSTAAPPSTTSLNFGSSVASGIAAPTTTSIATTTATGFPFGTAGATPQFGLGSTLSIPTTTSTGLSFGTASTAPTSSINTSLGAILNFGALPTTTSAPSLGFTALGSTTVSSTAPTFALSGITTTTPANASALPAAGTLTFSQLEDAINKWSVDLEEQGKVFANQAKNLNAWDRLLMANGEKILNVSNDIDRIKQQQQQLDQELDFVLAQQKELEECIVTLEKEYCDLPVTDVDRDQTYKLAENIDAQLKQMSEDLKEIIEHLNESNKAQELSDPVAQIGRILNAHMNSLQWIDRNTAQITAQLDEITKMQDLNKRNHENLHGA